MSMRGGKCVRTSNAPPSLPNCHPLLFRAPGVPSLGRGPYLGPLHLAEAAASGTIAAPRRARPQTNQCTFDFLSYRARRGCSLQLLQAGFARARGSFDCYVRARAPRARDSTSGGQNGILGIIQPPALRARCDDALPIQLRREVAILAPTVGASSSERQRYGLAIRRLGRRSYRQRHIYLKPNFLRHGDEVQTLRVKRGGGGISAPSRPSSPIFYPPSLSGSLATRLHNPIQSLPSPPSTLIVAPVRSCRQAERLIIGDRMPCAVGGLTVDVDTHVPTHLLWLLPMPVCTSALQRYFGIASNVLVAAQYGGLVAFAMSLPIPLAGARVEALAKAYEGSTMDAEFAPSSTSSRAAYQIFQRGEEIAIPYCTTRRMRTGSRARHILHAQIAVDATSTGTLKDY
ncbi:hypothetical protein GY45DRAFT_1359479 [Cubamyces sp. BRFM 1775]|nr:hypothetical protein GY45DRAFT_1359479 [Cubamyces sp. BRFM 1775]